MNDAREPIQPSWARWRSRLLFLATMLGAVLVVTETFTWAIFKWPEVWIGRVPIDTERFLIGFYNEFFRGPHLQFRPDCYEPDPELLYRPKPGACRFATQEFDTELRTSPRHLREDRSTDRPDIVFLGDSYTIGWGVEREEAYPSLVAGGSGIEGTVVGASSYGTVRELLLLRRLGLRDFRGVVLQYSHNDVNENVAFARLGRHEPSAPAVYEKSLAITGRIYGKTFFKRSRHWLSLARERLFPSAPAVPPPTSLEGHVRALLVVLGAFADDLKGRPILIFAEGFGDDERTFVKTINDAPKPPGLGAVKAIEVTGRLSPSDYFRMDVHWRPSAHKIVAAMVAGELERSVPRLEASSAPARETTVGRFPGFTLRLTSFPLCHQTDGMIRTQIQLPTVVYERARRVAKAKEISLAELARRGIETILDQYPAAEAIDPGWSTPLVRSGGVKVSLERLKDFGEVDTSAKPLKRKRSRA